MTAALLILLAVGPVTTMAPVPKVVAKTSWYPTAVGTKWVYVQPMDEWTDEVTAAERKTGGVTLSVRRTSGAESSELTYTVAGDGVTLRRNGEVRLDHLLVRFPPKAGDSWAVDTPVQKDIICEGGPCTVGEAEEVIVLAGTFRAFPVAFEATRMDGKDLPKAARKYTRWYAEGVGLVKMRMESGFVQELKSFTPGK